MLKQPAKHSLNRGVLIAIEGIDGAGKTTQAELLRKNLEGKGYQVEAFKEPTSAETGDRIRQLGKNGRTEAVEVEFKLFLEDRRYDVQHNILPALASGKVVIVDRYYYSSMAYQGARGMSPQYIEQENLKFAPKPDLTIFLDISPQTAEERIRSRNQGKNHFERSLKPIRDIFKQMMEDHPEITAINGEEDAETVDSKILDAVLPVIANYQD